MTMPVAVPSFNPDAAVRAGAFDPYQTPEHELSDEQILGRLTERVGLFQSRNSEYAIMRAAFDGNLEQSLSSQGQLGAELSQLRRIQYNLLNVTTRRYMDEMSSDVLLIATARGPLSKDTDLAERRSKLLAEIWHENKMSLKVMQAAFYQSLLDRAIFHVRPSKKLKCRIAIDLVIPEMYYPAPTTTRWDENRDAIIAWRPNPMGYLIDPRGRLTNQPLLLQGAIVGYYNRGEFRQIPVGPDGLGRANVKVKHDFGHTTFVEVENIPIPHRQRGQGDNDQALGLNRYLNELITDQANVLTYMAHPIIVLRGIKSGHTQLPTGPQAVWELERDGAAEILTWAGAPPTFESQIIRIMQAIEDATGISSPAFGRDIPSGVSGDAIRSILAGFNTRIGAKQTLMGLGLVEVFELAQRILEKDFKDEMFNLPGEVGPWSSKPAVIRPGEFEGWHRLAAVFQPQNETVRTFQELQKMKDGVQSKYTTMRRLGIMNPNDEIRRIKEEKKDDVMEAMARNGTFAQPGQPIGAGYEAFAKQYGGGPKKPLPQPRTDSIVDPKAIAAQLGTDPGTLADRLGGDRAKALQRTGGGVLEVQDVEERLANVEFNAPVHLAGNIVEEGETPDRFTVVVQDAEDIPQVQLALGELAGRADIKTQDELPNKAYTSLRVGRAYRGK